MMNYSPKLKSARMEIEEVLARYDIAGHVVLHTPGFGEVFVNLSPSYSRIHGTLPLVRLRSTLAEYDGDREAQRRDLEHTANMLQVLADLIGPAAIQFADLAAFVNERLGAEHGEGTFVPDRKPRAPRQRNE